jgi:hypothetical protein
MKRSLIVILLFLLFIRICDAQDLWKQQRVEVFGGLGTTQFFGDIGGFSQGSNIIGLKDISFLQTRYNISAGAKYKILKDLNVRLNLAYGMFHATDSRGSNELRGFDAKTTIFEPSILAEYYFIKSKLGDSYLFNKDRGVSLGSLFSSVEFYFFTGAGGLLYNVKENAKLAAMGQPKSGFTAVIPVGIGANLLFKPEFNLGVELGGRYSFSDYLDGYSSQYSRSNDVYYFFNVTFTYKIRTNSQGIPLFLVSRRKF